MYKFLFLLLFAIPLPSYSNDTHYNLHWRSGETACLGRWAYKEYNDCRHRNHGVESFNFDRHEKCGVESYNWGVGSQCGVKTYNERASAACGIESYKTGWVLVDNGTEHPISSFNQSGDSITVNSHTGYSYPEKTFKVNHLSFSAPRGSQDNIILIPFNWDRRIVKKTNDSRFGVEKYKKCRLPEFGVEEYNRCQHSDFGAEKYKRCRVKENGVENYVSRRSKACGISEQYLLTSANNEPQLSPFAHRKNIEVPVDSALCTTGDHLPILDQKSFDEKFDFLQSRIVSYQENRTKMQKVGNQFFGPINENEFIEVVSMLKEMALQKEEFLSEKAFNYISLIDDRYPNFGFGGMDRWENTETSSRSSRFSTMSSVTFLQSWAQSDNSSNGSIVGSKIRSQNETSESDRNSVLSSRSSTSFLGKYAEKQARKSQKGKAKKQSSLYETESVTDTIGEAMDSVDFFLDDASSETESQTSTDTATSLQSHSTSHSSNSSKSRTSSHSSRKTKNSSVATRKAQKDLAANPDDTSRMLGFANLGNTCFANSVHKMLSAYPKFLEFLNQNIHTIDGGLSGNPEHIRFRADIQLALSDLMESFNTAWKHISHGEEHRTYPGKPYFRNQLTLLFDRWDAYLAASQDGNKYFLNQGDFLRMSQIDAPAYLEKLLNLLEYQNYFNSFSESTVAQRIRGEASSASILKLAPEPRSTISELVAQYFDQDSPIGNRLFVDNPNQESPKQVFVQLKRFSFKDGRTIKIKEPVDPLEPIRLRYYANQVAAQEPGHKPHRSKMDLKAVVVHRGDNGAAGHYVTYVRQENNRGWVLHNDQRVSFCGGNSPRCEEKTLWEVEDEIRTSGYLFLYSKN